MKNVFEIMVDDSSVSAKALVYIKQATNKSLSEIKSAIKENLPFYGCGLSDDSGIKLIIDMHEKLSIMGIQTTLLQNSNPESIECFNNILKAHLDTAREVGLDEDEVFD